MRYANQDQTIIDAGNGVFIPANTSNADYAAIVKSGIVIAPYTPPKPAEQDYANAIQSHIDAFAKGKGYADGVGLASYTTSTNPQWSAEAHAFVVWRDAIWSRAYAVLGQVQAGQRLAPTIDGLIGELPAPPTSGSA